MEKFKIFIFLFFICGCNFVGENFFLDHEDISYNLLSPFYQSPITYSTGANPASVFAGDLNGDGHIDVVTADYTANELSLFLNNGDGTLAARQILAIANSYTNPNDIKLGDLNGDDILDIALVSAGSSRIIIKINNGDGTFVPDQAPITGASPFGLDIVDMNGDGHLDIVTADLSAQRMAVFLNNGSGVIATTADFNLTTVSGAYGISAGDLNNDGTNDLAVSVTGVGNNIRIGTNDGTGTLTASGDYAAGTTPKFLHVAELNGDSSLDIVSPASGSDFIRVFINDGAGGFASFSDIATGAHPIHAYATDLDNDGDNDIIVSERDSNQFSVRLNDGAGNFTHIGNFSTGGQPYQVHAADLDGDGMKEIISADYNSAQITVYSPVYEVIRNSTF